MNSAPLTVEQEFERLKAAVQKLHDDCAPYLKDGEGIVERLARYHDETQSLLGELAKAKIALEEMGGALQKIADLGDEENEWDAVDKFDSCKAIARAAVSEPPAPLLDALAEDIDYEAIEYAKRRKK